MAKRQKKKIKKVRKFKIPELTEAKIERPKSLTDMYFTDTHFTEKCDFTKIEERVLDRLRGLPRKERRVVHTTPRMVEVPVIKNPPHKFKKGDRVYLREGRYHPSMSNPVKGTKYESEGTIYYISAISGNCEVRWDNDRSNDYNSKSDLLPVNTEIKNCKSIW